MNSIFNQAFDDLSFALRADPDDDVTEDHNRLLVRGRVFAFLSGSSLVVDLPAPRVTDLVSRGIVAAEEAEAVPNGAWASINETDNWLELATEAHQFVGEPAVGGES